VLLNTGLRGADGSRPGLPPGAPPPAFESESVDLGFFSHAGRQRNVIVARNAKAVAERVKESGI
jgi:hypothetical protein